MSISDDLNQADILKEEKVMFFPTKTIAYQGNIYLTKDRLVVKAHKAGVGGMGLLGSILKRKVESKTYGFDIERNSIKKLEKSKRGVHKNILEITDNQDNIHRVAVKSFDEWEALLMKNN